jgi:hypothetical protein
MATKADIAALRGDVDKAIGALRGDVDRAVLGLRTDLRTLEERVDRKLAELKAELIKYMVTQTVATVGLVVAMGGLLIRFLR